MLVVALRQLHGATYGTVSRGQQFEVDDESAQNMLDRGLVSLPETATKKTYTIKVVTPGETKPKTPKATKAE